MRCETLAPQNYQIKRRHSTFFFQLMFDASRDYLYTTFKSTAWSHELFLQKELAV